MRTARFASATLVMVLAAACASGGDPAEETGVLGVSIERPAASEPAAAVTRTPTPTPTPSPTPTPTETTPAPEPPAPPPPPTPTPEPPPPPPPTPTPEPEPEPTPVESFTVYSETLGYDGNGGAYGLSATSTQPAPPGTATLHHESRDNGTVAFACSGTLTPPEGHTADGTLTLTLFEDDAVLLTVSSPGQGTQPTNLAVGPHETDMHEAGYHCELTYAA